MGQKDGSAKSVSETRQILGITFFGGSSGEAIARMNQGGLLVVPAAPALKDLGTNAQYREALLQADLAIADSAYMVLIWNLLNRDHLRRLSGLEYLRALLLDTEFRTQGKSFWIMASSKSAELNLAWLAGQGILISPECSYLAPRYGAHLDDRELVEKLNRLRPKHIVVTVGGGTQERLGLYLKRHLDYLPAIHCIGAAIAFLSGDQVRIPVWADRFYLGWLYRSLSEPKLYVPRYWGARKLFMLMLKYRSELPPLKV